MKGAERRSEPPPPTVLVVDDEPDIRELLELTLLRMGLDVERAMNVKEALAKLAGRVRPVPHRHALPDGAAWIWYDTSANIARTFQWR
jgi:CheY-like chemotaxis protein